MCENCKYALYDFEDYYGGGKQYFVCGCKKDLPEPDEDGECESYKEYRFHDNDDF